MKFPIQSRILSFLILSLILTVWGCSDGGSTRVDGTQCPANYNPIAIDTLPTNQTKLSLKPDLADLPPAAYIYQGADLYYVDQATDFRIHIRHAKQEDGTFKPIVNCVRNAKPEVFLSGGLKIESVSSLTVNANADIETKVNEFGFHTDEYGRLAAFFNTDVIATEDSLEKALENTGDAFLVKVNDLNYDVRSRGITDKNETFYLSIRFTKPN